MIKFLKIYSIIPDKFINEYYGFIGENHDFDSYIDLSDVAKWLKIDYDELKDILETKFEIGKFGIGYDVEENGEIKLGKECFKKLCMICDSPKADEVREYHLMLEDLIERCYIDIEDGISSKIGFPKPKRNKMGGITNFFELSEKGKMIPILALRVDNLEKVQECINKLSEMYPCEDGCTYEMNRASLKKLCRMCIELTRGFVEYKEKKGEKEFYRSLKRINEAGKLMMKLEHGRGKKVNKQKYDHSMQEDILSEIATPSLSD